MRVTGFENDPHSEQGSACPRNYFGITDYERLSRRERILSAARLHELERKGIIGDFNAAHLRKIHWYIFRDVFPWAGELRQVPMSKGGGAPFGYPAFILSSLADVLEKLRTEKYLAGLDRRSFAKRAAFYLGQVNAIHAFREGNGRTQREFFRQLALHCGHVIVWDSISKEENVAASIRSHVAGDDSGLEAVFLKALTEEAL